MRGRVFLIATALTALVNATVWAGDNKPTATHMGGTVGLFSGIGGTLTVEPDDVTFKPASAALTLQIPYKDITGLEFGPQAGSRVPIVMLGSKNKKAQYLTINWMDAGKEQAVVLELSKDVMSQTLTELESKSGKTIQYQTAASR